LSTASVVPEKFAEFVIKSVFFINLALLFTSERWSTAQSSSYNV